MSTSGNDEAEAQFLGRAGEIIRLGRKAADLTQDEPGRLIGLGRSSVANIEAGRQTISLHQAAMLAAVLPVDVTALLGVPGLPPGVSHEVSVRISCSVSCKTCGNVNLDLERSADYPAGGRREHVAAVQGFLARVVEQMTW